LRHDTGRIGTMSTRFPRSPYDREGGLVYFPRLVDKIRLHQRGELPEDYHANLGAGFDLRCCDFLNVDYDALTEQVRAAKSEGLGMADRTDIQTMFDLIEVDEGREPGGAKAAGR
jgi:hypothetical protein